MGDESSSDSRETVTDQDLLDTLRQTESPVIATSEVAEAKDIPIEQGQVLKRLKSLEERDRVGSKSFSAKPQIRLWWYKGLEVKEAWTSENEIKEKIGIEAVDVLDLPGRGEKLRKRREAVNSVFKFLFDVEAATKKDLSLVGWGADMETYATRESLWNNCLKKALDQSPIYILQESEKTWTLSNLGSYIKDIDNHALWENWNENKTKIERLYYQILWSSIFETENQITYDIENNSSIVGYEYGKYSAIIVYAVYMHGPVWFTSTGDFDMILHIQEESEDLEMVLENIDDLTSNLGTDFQIKNLIDEELVLQIRCSYPINIDASAMVQQLNKDNYTYSLPSLKGLSRWERKTRKQLIEVNEKINQLIKQN